MGKKIAVLLTFVLVILALAAAVALTPDKSDAGGDSYEISGDAVGIININGEITAGSSEPDIWGYSSGICGADTVMQYLREAAADDQIKAVVLRINSPGGSATAGQEIAEEVAKLASQKTVVTSMNDTAASAGYWIASQSSKIMANASTMTGSIGVILTTADMQELYEKIGINYNVIKSSEMKDIGASYRDMTEAEEKVLQDFIDDVYDQFVAAICSGRSMERAAVEKIAQGQIYTGQQAQKLGLVDELGNYYDAIEWAKELAGLDADTQVITLDEQDLTWKQLFSQGVNQIVSALNINNNLNQLSDQNSLETE